MNFTFIIITNIDIIITIVIMIIILAVIEKKCRYMT